MMNKNYTAIFAVASVLVFVLLSLAYFQPVLLQKVLPQEDIINYKGAAEESIRLYEETGEKTFWTNSMFGGMPNYQIWSVFDHYYIYKIHNLINFLPEPANFLFVLLLGFFVLGYSLFRNWTYALVGALFFAFSTYNFIIIEAGHNTKVLAMAYFPPVAAGILLLYRKKYALGFLITAVFLSLQILANHIQITYYYFLAMLLFLPIQFYKSIKQNEIKDFAKASSLALIAAILALGVNSARLYTTYEYTKHTTRGQAPILENSSNQSNEKNGLTYDYITNWSYGKLETLNLMIPNFTGGGSLSDEENMANFVEGIQSKPQSEEDFYKIQSLLSPSTYWGDQPFTKGPAYLGIVVIFLAILSVFFIPKKYKWWLVSAAFLGIVLAWGKNIEWLTRFLVDNFPLYNKFRSVSMALVITQFAVSAAAIMGLFYFLEANKYQENHRKRIFLLVSSAMMVFLFSLYFFGSSLFPFLSSTELQNLVENQSVPMIGSIAEDLKKDRVLLFKADVLRAVFYLSIAIGLLALLVYKKLNYKLPIVLAIGFLAMVDLWTVDKKYLNNDQFVYDYLIQDFFPTEVNEELKAASEQSGAIRRMVQLAQINNLLNQIKDNDKNNYRILNAVIDPFNEANTSYFHHSIGGYHGAKLRNYQDVIDQHLGNNQPSMEVLNMLNTKYILQASEGKLGLMENQEARGNAWFVENLSIVKDDRTELFALDTLKSQNTAVLSQDVYKNPLAKSNPIDSTSTIVLTEYKPNQLVYNVNSKTGGFVVFSEVYYPDGWNLVIVDKEFKNPNEIEILPTNYFLRGAFLPAGNYQLKMYFEPISALIGEMLNLVFHILLLISVLVSLYFVFKKVTPKEE